MALCGWNIPDRILGTNQSINLSINLELFFHYVAEIFQIKCKALINQSQSWIVFQLNHFPGSFQIGRKDRLWRNLSKLQVQNGKKEFGFFPQTFVLPSDMKLLKRAWEDGGPKQKWIVKPVSWMGFHMYSRLFAHFLRRHCLPFLSGKYCICRVAAKTGISIYLFASNIRFLEWIRED